MMAAAACGMSEDEFWDSTPRYLAAAMKAEKNNQQTGWELARFVSVHTRVAAGMKIRKLTDLVRFPWEKVREMPAYTEEDIENLKVFDREADLILKKYNPTAYEQYIKAKEGGQ